MADDVADAPGAAEGVVVPLLLGQTMEEPADRRKFLIPQSVIVGHGSSLLSFVRRSPGSYNSSLEG